MAPFVHSKRRSLAALLLAVAACGMYMQVSSGPDFVSGIPAMQAGRQLTISRQSKVDDIVEELKGLTLLEASELVKAIEETFGVDASASAGAVVMAAPGAAGGGEAAEAAPEKTEFDVVLKEVPKEKKIAIIKALRAITGLGLKEAKGLADNPGKFIEGKPKEFCEDAVKQLEEAGAKAVIECKSVEAFLVTCWAQSGPSSVGSSSSLATEVQHAFWCLWVRRTNRQSERRDAKIAEQGLFLTLLPSLGEIMVMLMRLVLNSSTCADVINTADILDLWRERRAADMHEGLALSGELDMLDPVEVFCCCWSKQPSSTTQRTMPF
ncbi:rpl12 [Symbiodinium pilosum]|uniref:Rpl12 protein n=1 Tax=Symbiodinium pilosum TaxID=2952 RepID=A0A812WNC7_SYMPI|nr:rpl12 [Symbiodinium pilosum]